MFFGNKAVKLKYMDTKFLIDGHALIIVGQIKLLSALLNFSLNWSNLINYLNIKFQRIIVN